MNINVRDILEWYADELAGSIEKIGSRLETLADRCERASGYEAAKMTEYRRGASFVPITNAL
ncbi:MAG TPA: hypothetical protein VJL57_03765 [Candidatus Paceibacterota bacterium]